MIIFFKKIWNFILNHWLTIAFTIVFLIPGTFALRHLLSKQDDITQLQTWIFIYQLLFALVLGLAAIDLSKRQINLINKQIELSNNQNEVNILMFLLSEHKDDIKDIGEILKNNSINDEHRRSLNKALIVTETRYHKVYEILQNKHLDWTNDIFK